MTTPVSFAYGKRDPKNAPAIKFAAFYKALPVYQPVDYGLLYPHWDQTMDGNDAAGDCVACEWANDRRLISIVLTGTAETITQANVWTVYETQNQSFDPNGDPNLNGPGSNDDQGMDMQTLWEYLLKTPGPDGQKLLGFAKVDHNDLAEVSAAIAVGGRLAIGVQVQAAQQTQFQNDEPWAVVQGSPVEGGHAIMLVGTMANGNYKAVCWAKEFEVTPGFLSQMMDEAWFLIWPEMIGSKEFQAGVSVAVFAELYTEITGNPFPVSVEPTPAPEPVPTPDPVPPTPPAPVAEPPSISAPAENAEITDHIVTVNGQAAGDHTLNLYDTSGNQIIGNPDSSTQVGSITVPQSGTFTLTYQVGDGSHVVWGMDMTNNTVSNLVDFTVNTQPAPPPPAPTPPPAPPVDVTAALIESGTAWVESRWHDFRLERQLKHDLRKWIEAQE